MKRIPLLFVLAVVCFWFASAGCSAGYSREALSISPQERRSITAIWEMHLAAVQAPLIDGVPYDLVRFGAAVNFFEDLTGIESDTGSWAGRLPFQNRWATIDQWKKWYSKHKHQLEIDPLTHKIRLIDFPPSASPDGNRVPKDGNRPLNDPGSGAIGLKQLKELARTLGRQVGAKTVQIVGETRTTGANPGHKPRPITIRLD